MENTDLIKNHILLNGYLKKPYSIELSNYSYKINSPLNSIKSCNDKPTKFFIAGAMIKKDCIKKPIPFIDKNELHFFNYNFSQFNKIKNNFFYGIDIKSAYATILLNNDYLSKKTFNYIQSLPKLDRLGAIGMLASNKKIFFFDENNNLIDCQNIVSKNEGYFYFCVKELNRIMDLIQSKINSYLFFWVDCIYFSNPKDIIIIENELKKLNFNYTIKNMANYQIKDKKLTFDEIDADGVIKKKTFFLPKKNYKYKNLIEKHINLYHNKKTI
jgi:hypothetical protein